MKKIIIPIVILIILCGLAALYYYFNLPVNSGKGFAVFKVEKGETVRSVAEKLKMLESRLIETEKGEKYVDGYFLTLEQLAQLVRDFQADCFDGFVSNDESYIELWIEKNGNHETE